MKRSIILILTAVLLFSQPQNTKAQSKSQDSLSYNRRQAATLLIPAGLVAVGTLCHKVEPLQELNHSVRNEVQGWQMEKTKIDDYILYLPSVAFAAMNLTNLECKGQRIDNLMALPLAYLFMGTSVLCIKDNYRKLRPDGSAYNSFPSGHTATAFVGAELVRETYWETSPLYGIAAYTVASAVGFLRIYNDRHWLADVIAGAGFGIFSARLALLAAPYVRSFLQNRLSCLSKLSDNILITPFGSTKQAGLSLNISF